MTLRGRRRTGSWLAGYEPLDESSRAEVLREVLREARGLDTEEFERDVLPRLRRLTDEQRREVLELQLRDRGAEPTQRSARRRSSSTSASSRIADHVLMSDPDASASSTAARSFSARSRSLTAPPSLLP
jgi:hypothetical protein